jgi:hypothetical protein
MPTVNSRGRFSFCSALAGPRRAMKPGNDLAVAGLRLFARLQCLSALAYPTTW